MKTTLLGILVIISAVITAAVSFIKSGTFDFMVLTTALGAGWGLVKAADAKPAKPAITNIP